jgi:hypothetical protein
LERFGNTSGHRSKVGNPRQQSSGRSDPGQGAEIYQLRADGTIWRYMGVPISGWQKLDNNPAAVRIVATRRSLCQLHRDESIWVYTGVP